MTGKKKISCSLREIEPHSGAEFSSLGGYTQSPAWAQHCWVAWLPNERQQFRLHTRPDFHLCWNPSAPLRRGLKVTLNDISRWLHRPFVTHQCWSGADATSQPSKPKERLMILDGLHALMALSKLWKAFGDLWLENEMQMLGVIINKAGQWQRNAGFWEEAGANLSFSCPAFERSLGSPRLGLWGKRCPSAEEKVKTSWILGWTGENICCGHRIKKWRAWMTSGSVPEEIFSLWRRQWQDRRSFLRLVPVFPVGIANALKCCYYSSRMTQTRWTRHPEQIKISPHGGAEERAATELSQPWTHGTDAKSLITINLREDNPDLAELEELRA